MNLNEYMELCKEENANDEMHYWKNLENTKVVYGAGVDGTLFDYDQKLWNIGKIGIIQIFTAFLSSFHRFHVIHIYQLT